MPPAVRMGGLIEIVFSTFFVFLIAGRITANPEMYPANFSEQSILDQSDLDRDGNVDIDDLELFSSRWLKMDWREIDWCLWLKAEQEKQKHRVELLKLIYDEFGCGQTDTTPNLLAVEHENRHPARICRGSDSLLYVSDPNVGSVFIYSDSLRLIGELKGLSVPLGLAVDHNGSIYVGNNGGDNIGVFDRRGVRIRSFGHDIVSMPNDMTFDRDYLLYVVDSDRHLVLVFDTLGALVRSIGRHGDGPGQFIFPAAATIAYRIDPATGVERGELYLADQGHSLIQVFSLDGTFLRSYGGKPVRGMMGMGWRWYGKFVSIQSLSFDASGRLHAADAYMGRIQILDPLNGTYLGSYGEKGTSETYLKTPLDILWRAAGQVIVANYGMQRVEAFTTP